MFKKNGTVNGRQICENALWTHCPIFIEHEYVGKCASRSIILDKVNAFSGGGGVRTADISVHFCKIPLQNLTGSLQATESRTETIHHSLESSQRAQSNGHHIAQGDFASLHSCRSPKSSEMCWTRKKHTRDRESRLLAFRIL